MGAGGEALLECRGLARRFGGVSAVAGLDLTVQAGETVGIVGANGAGKTTLFNLIGGQQRQDAGSIVFAGQRIDGLPAYEVCRRGIGRTFQAVSNAATQTVLENVALAAVYAEPKRFPSLRFGGRVLDRALDAISFVGLEGLESRLARTLSVYQQKRLMIAAALACGPRLLLLDEPVGGLAPYEIDESVGLVRRIEDRGMTMLVVEHVMSFLVRVAPRRILVMHQGRRLFEGSPAEVSRNELVRDAWLGSGAAGVPVAGQPQESDL